MKTFSSKLFHLFDIHYFTRILPTIFVYYTKKNKNYFYFKNKIFKLEHLFEKKSNKH